MFQFKCFIFKHFSLGSVAEIFKKTIHPHQSTPECNYKKCIHKKNVLCKSKNVQVECFPRQTLFPGRRKLNSIWYAHFKFALGVFICI